jgi:hypothetical protein
MTPNQSHVAGLELALDLIDASGCDYMRLKDLIDQAKSAPAEPDWREHSRHIAKGEQCPETLDTLQAAWARDQELIDDMRHEIARHKMRINRLEQRRAPSPGNN